MIRLAAKSVILDDPREKFIFAFRRDLIHKLGIEFDAYKNIIVRVKCAKGWVTAREFKKYLLWIEPWKTFRRSEKTFRAPELESEL